MIRVAPWPELLFLASVLIDFAGFAKPYFREELGDADASNLGRRFQFLGFARIEVANLAGEGFKIAPPPFASTAFGGCALGGFCVCSHGESVARSGYRFTASLRFSL